MKLKMKRAASLLLAILMLFGMLPVEAAELLFTSENEVRLAPPAKEAANTPSALETVMQAIQSNKQDARVSFDVERATPNPVKTGEVVQYTVFYNLGQAPSYMVIVDDSPAAAYTSYKEVRFKIYPPKDFVILNGTGEIVGTDTAPYVYKLKNAATGITGDFSFVGRSLLNGLAANGASLGSVRVEMEADVEVEDRNIPEAGKQLATFTNDTIPSTHDTEVVAKANAEWGVDKKAAGNEPQVFSDGGEEYLKFTFLVDFGLKQNGVVVNDLTLYTRTGMLALKPGTGIALKDILPKIAKTALHTENALPVSAELSLNGEVVSSYKKGENALEELTADKINMLDVSGDERFGVLEKMPAYTRYTATVVYKKADFELQYGDSAFDDTSKLFTVSNKASVTFERVGDDAPTTAEAEASVRKKYEMEPAKIRVTQRIVIDGVTRDYTGAVKKMFPGAKIAVYAARDWDDAAGAAREGAVPKFEGNFDGIASTYLETGNLPAGDYVAVQTGLPENTAADPNVGKAQHLTVAPGETGMAAFVNPMADGFGMLRIRKTDDAGQPMSGVGFILREKAGGANVSGVEYTDVTGEASFFVKAGSYALHEENAPEGFIRMQPVEVTVESRRINTAHYDAPIKNIRNSSSVTIRKFAAEYVSAGHTVPGLPKKPNIAQFDDPAKFTFALTRSSDGEHWDTVNAAIPLNSEGSALIENLERADAEGKYYTYKLKENDAPDSVLSRDEYEHSFTFTADTLYKADFYNTVSSAFRIKKVFKENGPDGEVKTEAKSGVGFKLYRKLSGAANYELVQEDLTTDGQGLFTTRLLPIRDGTGNRIAYYLLEDQASLEGHTLSSADNKTGVKTDSGMPLYGPLMLGFNNLTDLSAVAGSVMENRENTGALRVYKTETGKNQRLAGAKFKIYTLEGGAKEYLKDDQGDRVFETLDNADTVIIDLPLGTYYVEEIEPPKGYMLTAPVASFTIDSPMKTGVIRLQDKPLPTLEGQKKQMRADTGAVSDAAVPGIVFELYKLENGSLTPALDEQGAPITLTTDANGRTQRIALTDYEAEYYIRETNVPYGMFAPEDADNGLRTGAFQATGGAAEDLKMIGGKLVGGPIKVNAGGAFAFSFTNRLNRGTVQLNKVDAKKTDLKLKGFKIDVFVTTDDAAAKAQLEKLGFAQEGGRMVLHADSGAEKSFIRKEELPFFDSTGRALAYSYIETEPPEGYMLPRVNEEKPISFDLSRPMGGLYTADIPNVHKAVFSMTKYGYSEFAAKGATAGIVVWGLAGAKFALYRLDEMGKLVFMEEKTSGPSLDFNNLYSNEHYYLIETESAPEYRVEVGKNLLQPANALDGRPLADLRNGNFVYHDHDFSRNAEEHTYIAPIASSVRNGRPYVQIQLTKYLDLMDGSAPTRLNFSRFKLHSASKADFDAVGSFDALKAQGKIKTDDRVYESGTDSTGTFATGELNSYRVYWLEEVEATPGTMPRDGAMTGPITFTEEEFDRIKNVNFFNKPLNLSGGDLQAVQFKLKKLIESDDGNQEPLNDIKFDFYVADKNFKKIKKIADVTTGQNKDNPASFGIGVTNSVYIDDAFAAEYGPDVVTKNQDGTYTFNMVVVESEYPSLLVTPREGGVYEHTVTSKPLDQGMGHLNTHFFDNPIINDPGVRISVEIEKRGYAVGEDPAAGALLKGAQIGVYTDAGCTRLYAKRTTTASGVARFSLRPQKDYWFKEISAPDGYEINSEIFRIPAQTEKPEKPLHYVINDPKLRELEIVKRDADGGIVSGALLRVSNADGSPLLDGNNRPGAKDTYVTGETSFLRLRGDGKYYVNEESLAGKPLSAREKEYFVIANGLDKPISFGKNEHHKRLEVVNPGLAELTITKHDNEGVPLEGVEFTLRFKPFKNNTTTEPAGAFGFLEGKTEETKVTVNGSLTLRDLVPGWYEIIETIPEGFVGAARRVIPVYGKMLGGDKTGKNTLDVVNIPLRYLKLVKQYTVLDSETVPSKAVFHLYTDPAGRVPADPARVEIDIADGKGDKQIVLPVGVYYLREEAQEPFVPYAEGKPVKGLIKAEITKANMINAPLTVEFNNVSRWGRIDLTKTDAKTPGTPLPGAEFALYYRNAAGQEFFYQEDDTWAANDVNRKLWRTEINGRAELRFLKPDDGTDTFFLKEMRAPAGYVEGDNSHLKNGLVVADAGTQAARVVNVRGVTITVIKHGMPFEYVKENEQHLLTGAEFTLYEVHGDDLTLLDSQKTDGSGEAFFTDLPKLKDGAYYAIEESGFCEGYLKKLEDVRANGVKLSSMKMKGHTLFRVAAAEDEVTVHAYNVKAGRLMLLKHNVLRPTDAPENLTFTITKKDDAAFTPLTRKVTKVSGAAFPAAVNGYAKTGDYYEKDGVMYTAALADGLEPGTYEVTESFDDTFRRSFFYPQDTTAADAWYRTHEVVLKDDGEIITQVFGNLPYDQPKSPDLQKTVKAANGQDGVNELKDLQDKEQSLTYTLSGFALPETGKHLTIPVDAFTVEDTRLAFKDTNGDSVTNVTATVQSVVVGAAKYVPTDLVPNPDNTAPIMAAVYGVMGGTETKVAEVNVRGGAQRVILGKKYAGFKVVYQNLKPGFTAEPIEATVNFKQGEDEQNNPVAAIHNTASAYAAYTLVDKQEKTVPQTATATTPVVEFAEMPRASIAKTGVLVDANGQDQPVGGAFEYKHLGPGDNIKYTITVTNHASPGNKPIIDPVVLDKLPEIFEPDMGKVTLTAPAGMTPDEPTLKDGYLVYPVDGELKAGESITVVVPGTIKTTAYDYKGNRVLNAAYLISRHRAKVNAANPLGTSFVTDGGQRPPYAIPGGVVGDGKDFDAIKAENALPFVTASQVKIFKLGSGNVSGLDNFVGGEGYATVNPKGEIRYRIVVVNGGQNPILKVRVADIMPFVGDRTMGMTDQRFSKWEVELVSVSASDSAQVYSSQSGTPARDSLYKEIDSAVWTAGVQAGARAVLIDFGDKKVGPGESLTVNITARVKDMDDATLDAAYFLQANNNATMARDLKSNSLSASNLAKMTLVPGTTSIGNRVWVDLNGDGIQQGSGIDDPAGTPEEPSYTAGGLSMMLRTYENGANKGTQTTSVTGGFYGFDNLVTGEPKAGEEGNLFDGNGNVRQEYLRGAMRMTYQLQVAGIPAGYLPSPAFVRSAGSGPQMMADGSDSNFSMKHAVVSELFYLTTGRPDMKKDLGLVPVRNLKITKVENRYGQALDNAVFAIYGPFDSLDGAALNAGNKLGEIKTVDGTATFTSKQGAMLLRAKHYVVVEEDSGNVFADKTTLKVRGNGVIGPESFTPTGAMISGTNYFGLVKGTADALGDTDLDIQAENEYRATGELFVAVKKDLKGRALRKDDFTFTVTSGDHPGFAPVTVKNEADGYAVLGPIAYTEKDIGKIYSYSVSEGERAETGLLNDATKGVFSVTVSDDKEGRITAAVNESFDEEQGGAKVVKTFHNVVRGNLTVKKTVKGNAGDKERAFTFRIHLDGIPAGEQRFEARGKLQEVVFTDGDASVALKDGEYLTITGIVAGTPYQVTEREADLDHYVTTAQLAAGNVAACAAADEGAVAGFTNEKNTGDLTVTKTIKGNDPTTDTLFPFSLELSNDRGSVDGEYKAQGVMDTVTVTDGKVEGLALKGGDSLTIKGLPVGTSYRVTETDSKGYQATVDGNEATVATGAITKEGGSHGFVNKKLVYGDLTVEKKLDAGDNGSAVGALSDKVYEMHLAFTPYTSFGDVYDANGIYDAVRVRADGTETAESVTIADNKLTVSLRRDEKLTIKKLYQNLKVKVTETDYTALGYTTRYENAEVTIAGAPATATVINKRQVGSLVVSKKTEGNAADANDTFTFTVTLKNDNGVAIDRTYPTNRGNATFAGGRYVFTLKNGESLEIGDIVVGTEIQVEEAATFDGVKGKVDLTAFGYITEPGSRTVEGKISAAGEQIKAAFVNSRSAYPVTVEKKLAGNAAHTDKYFRFDIRITHDAGAKAVFGNALTGSFDKLSGTMQATGEITFNEVNGGYEGYVLLKGGQSVTIADIPQGAKVTISESDAVRAAGGEAESLRYLGYVVTGGSMDKALTQAEKLTVTNTRDAGTLEVTNRLTGSGAHFEDAFAYTFTFTDPDGTPTNRTFSYTGMKDGAPVTGRLEVVNGTAQIMLKHNESIKLTDILYQTGYTVRQAVHARYGYLTTPDTYEFAGTITAPETKHDYLNERWTGPLTVSKTVGGNRGNAAKEFRFVLTVINPDGTPSTRPLSYVGTGKPNGELRFNADGKAAFTLKHGEQIRVPDILRDSKFAIVEEDANLGGYVTEVVGNETGVMTVDGEEVSYVNIRNEYGSLVVSKALAGNAGDKSEYFDFEVTLTNEDGTPFEGALPTLLRAQNGRLVFRNGKAALRLKGGDSLVIGPMLTGTTYTVTEAKTRYVVRAQGDKGLVKDNNAVYVAAFQNTCNTANLTIKKQVEEDNLDRRGFTFVVTLKENGIPVDRTFATEGASDGKPLTFENGQAKIVLRGGQSLTILGIQTDYGMEYSVKELTGAEYKAVYSSAAGTLKDDVTCTVSNYLLGNPNTMGFPMNEGDCFN